MAKYLRLNIVSFGLVLALVAAGPLSLPVSQSELQSFRTGLQSTAERDVQKIPIVIELAQAAPCPNRYAGRGQCN